MPLAFDAIALAIGFSICNGALLLRRIRLEQAALRNPHAITFAAKPPCPIATSLLGVETKNRTITLIISFEAYIGAAWWIWTRSFGFLAVHDVAPALRPALRPQRTTPRTDPRAVPHARLSRAQREGINQAGLADLLEIRPMTLVRQIDRMQEAGWIERRPDPTDRRARRRVPDRQGAPGSRPHPGMWRSEKPQDQVLAALSAGDRSWFPSSGRFFCRRVTTAPRWPIAACRGRAARSAAARPRSRRGSGGGAAPAIEGTR